MISGPAPPRLAAPGRELPGRLAPGLVARDAAPPGLVARDAVPPGPAPPGPVARDAAPPGPVARDAVAPGQAPPGPVAPGPAPPGPAPPGPAPPGPGPPGRTPPEPVARKGARVPGGLGATGAEARQGMPRPEMPRSPGVAVRAGRSAPTVRPMTGPPGPPTLTVQPMTARRALAGAPSRAGGPIGRTTPEAPAAAGGAGNAGQRGTPAGAWVAIRSRDGDRCGSCWAARGPGP